MRSRNLTYWIGLAGVASDERPKARRWGLWFEAPMLALAIWMIVESYLSVKGAYPETWAAITDRAIWLFFAIETALLTYLVRDKRRYLLSNWLNLVIIVVGIPLWWGASMYVGTLRSLRILLVFGILFELSSTIRQILAKNNMGLTLFVSFLIIVMAGISIAAIDPGIDSPWDGIWWAWVTVTTVGYGDIVPDSPQGRIFGGILMLLGMGLFSLITANFAAFLITRDEAEIVEKEEEIIEKERKVASREGRIINQLESIENRLEELEKNLLHLVDRLPKLKESEDESND